MTVKNPLPVPEDVQGYPNNDKAVMIYARGKIRVVERQYYWDKQKPKNATHFDMKRPNNIDTKRPSTSIR